MSEESSEGVKSGERVRRGAAASIPRSRRAPRRESALEAELVRIERSGGDGVVQLSDDVALPVTNLDKVFFPDLGRTKGDVMRYYVRAAAQLLPLVADHPLILKRHPDGVGGKAFYQHEPPSDVPGGVRVAEVKTADGASTHRLIGGSLATLLYGVQLGSIDVNPWHSRVDSPRSPDYLVFDLDPGEKTSFGTVLDVALRVREILEDREVTSGVKTSGSRGVHIYVPLKHGTGFDAALAWAQDVAEAVQAMSPRITTIERALSDRPQGTVYVDYLQNSIGKSVAAPFSLRARPLGTVSMPLSWQEVEGMAVDPHAFTLDVSTRELDARARVWRGAMRRRTGLT